jgi:transposase-like protein
LGSHPPSGIVSDWKGSIVSGVGIYFHGIPHQRCLIHVIREAKRWLPKKTPFMFTKELRDIALLLPKIKTHKEAAVWKAMLIRWEKNYGHLLIEKTYSQTETTRNGARWWYTHKDLRRGWRLLTDNWYPFFVYLDHPLIPKDNNSLEGVNSQAKRFLGNHRGMKTPQQVSFLFWYLAFTRTKTKQDIKKLWDQWK